MSPAPAQASPPHHLFPPLLLAAYIACVAGAALVANSTLLTVLFKRSSNHGLNLILLQLAIADIILIVTTITPELWTLNEDVWMFGKEACIGYRGLNVFTFSAISYLVISIALHSLAAYNLEVKATNRRSAKNDIDEEIRSSRHSLVASSDSSTPPRTLSAEYHRSSWREPARAPSLLAWVLATSLSVPEFSLAVITSHQGRPRCASVDTDTGPNLYFILAMFNVFVPIFIMTTVGVLIVVKLNKRSKSVVSETVASLKLSLWLIVIYCVFCVPRSMTVMYRLYSESVSESETSVALTLAESASLAALPLSFSCAYLASALARPLSCLLVIPQIRRAVFGNTSRNTKSNDV